jgi:hypothetical protein
MLIALAATIAAGLGSRAAGSGIPRFLKTYAGDTLWASAAYFFIAALLPRTKPTIVAVIALALSVVVELSQLYHATWIDSIRATRPGGWILGFGFLWSDVGCYAAGVMLAFAIDLLLTAATRAAVIHDR